MDIRPRVLLVDDEGPQELGAYAVLHTSGRLTMAAGTVDDHPEAVAYARSLTA